MSVIVTAPYRNPKAINSVPGDTSWHKVANFPPDPNVMIGRFMVTSLASLTGGGSGDGFWVQMNKKDTAPTDQTEATWVHGNGQYMEFGGGINDLWYKMKTSTDILSLTYER